MLFQHFEHGCEGRENYNAMLTCLGRPNGLGVHEMT